jgi:dihydrodipicolinate synthase/N-acetylneuraminate lyase
MMLSPVINKIRAALKDNPVYFKAAMYHRGIAMNGPRKPMREMNPKEVGEMEAGLANLGLLIK